MSKTVREYYGNDSEIKSQGFIAGTELEIEDIHGAPGVSEGEMIAVSNYFPQMGDIPWKFTKDGSLRGAGLEFISAPLDVRELVEGFRGIHTKLVHPNKNPFSERTSIHVHVNCLDMEMDIVKNMVMWYALFEPVFFAMVAPNRANNIHCVPLDQTHLSTHYKKPLHFLVEVWSKYTALNLIPLATLGTIEFRHMEGHNDAVKFEWWLKTLENLWSWGKGVRLTREVVGSQEEILKAFDNIFADAPIRAIRSSVPALVADSLIDVKLALI